MEKYSIANYWQSADNNKITEKGIDDYEKEKVLYRYFIYGDDYASAWRFSGAECRQ